LYQHFLNRELIALMTDVPPLDNDLLLRAARREPTPRTPVWMMRQAGRYLPEYRALREKHEFFDVVRTPRLAAEVTLQPVERFPVDAAILFCDILVIPQALGLTVEMVSGKGPHFPNPLETPGDLGRLQEPNVRERLDYVLAAVTRIRRELAGRAPLIGFGGAPWTLMAYMIEGGGSKNFKRARSWLYQHPDASRTLLRRIADALAEFLVAQIEAGAQAVQVFDSWAGLLAFDEFAEFALPPLRRVAERVAEAHSDVPQIAFAKNAHYAPPLLVEVGYDVVSLDWTMDPRAVRKVADETALQGNLDPAALYAPPERIRKNVSTMLERFGPTGHIANLGHGMHPDHNPAHVEAFVEAVHELSEERRESRIEG
jgi:uroporphyrinogen decarboxylase